MVFLFEKFTRDEIALKHLDKIFNDKNIKIPKEVNDKKFFFEECVNSDDINVNEVDAEEIIKNSIKYGSRRFLYITKFDKPTKNRLQNPRFVLNALQSIDPDIKNLNYKNTLNSQDTNLIVNIEFNTDYLEYIDIEINPQNQVSSINLCLTNFERLNNNDIITYVKNFYWIEFLIEKNIIVFRVPSSALIFGEHVDSNQSFSEYFKLVEESFEVNFDEMSGYTETLYNIAKDIFEIAERPFIERFTAAEASLNRMSDFALRSNLFNGQPSYTLFNGRLKDLIERVIIQENFYEYMGYAEGKNGIITKLEFIDPTGASVRANAGTKKDDTLELCDIFFDTRKTLSDESKINQLIIDWFLPENLGNHNKVTCRFFVANRYLALNFQRIHLSKEVEEHVFSSLRGYEGFSWYFGN